MCLNPPRLFALIDIKSRQGDYFHWLFREQLVPHRPWDSVTPCQLDALQAPFYYLFYLRPHSMPHEHLVDCLDRFAVFAVSVFAMVLCSDDIYAQLSVLCWYHNFALIVQVGFLDVYVRHRGFHALQPSSYHICQVLFLAIRDVLCRRPVHWHYVRQ